MSDQNTPSPCVPEPFVEGPYPIPNLADSAKGIVEDEDEVEYNGDPFSHEPWECGRCRALFMPRNGEAFLCSSCESEGYKEIQEMEQMPDGTIHK
jgi:hypothetical protein